MSKISISEASSILKISIDTIRRWDKKGLIKSERDKQNQRIFDVKEVEKAYKKYIKGGKSPKLKFLKSKLKTKYKTVELFAGCGGLALGLENAGFNHSLLIEIDKNAVQTLKKNRPKWNIECIDVKDYLYKNIFADVVTGGFPCQAFSTAGNKLGFEDIRGTLFFELARAVKEIKPKIAVGENVKGLLRHDNGRTLKVMTDVMDEIGYNVVTKVLRAQYLDVPQKRERLFILCIRKDLDFPFVLPKEKDYTISLKEALNNVPYSVGQLYPEGKEKIMNLIPEGGYWKDLPDNLQREYMNKSYFMGGGKTGMARRLSWEEPSLTLTCAPAQKQTERCHPAQTRPLSVREYARIQTFPDSWIFEGSMGSQYKQIGNAVPVNLGYHLGRSLIGMLDKNIDYSTMQEIRVNDSESDQLTLFS